MRRVGDGSPALRKTGMFRGEVRTSRVTGPSSSCVPWCTRSLRLLPHFGLDPSSPLLLFEKIHGENAIAFRKFRPLGIRNVIVREGSSHRLRVDPRPTCSRAYASPVALPRSSQGSLPARAGSPLAGRVSHPLDDEIEISWSHRKPSNPNRPAEPGRTELPIPTPSLHRLRG